MKPIAKSLMLWVMVLASHFSRATETEHLNMQVLHAPGPVVIDGQVTDWDLSGGVFACGDVENARDKFAVWLHAMYDDKNLYILARWIDPTPMGNRGSVKGDYGFNGDCLQFRVVTAPDVTAPEVVHPDRDAKDAIMTRTSHLTCWRDRDGLDVIDIAYGRLFNESGLKDAKEKGAQQAFLKYPDGKGYSQEIAMPWDLLCKPNYKPKAGERMLLTFEPNFTVGSGGRLTIKDVFKPGVAIDRIFTFQGSGCWGFASLEAKGQLSPRPVRLSDAREFAVKLEQNVPVVDWTGVVKSREPDGFKPITFTAPEDGYVSLNLFKTDGSVARQLLSCAFYTKGPHTVKWDGLTTMSVRKPGEVLPAGEYSWEAIFHTGIGLKLRGWAGNSGAAPWGGAAWGADHGNPIACAADGERVYCGWGGGEGDKPLLACDPQGNVKWKNIRGGIASAGPLASDGTTVYAWNDVGAYVTRGIYRVDAQTGRYTEWSALKSTDLTMKDLWGDAKDAPQQPTALAAAKGRVFISFHEKNVICVVDAKTGTLQKKLEVTKPGDLESLDGQDVVVLSEAKNILRVNVESGQAKEIGKLELAGKDWGQALALDKTGNIYVGIRGESHQVQVFSPDGKLTRTIGRKGGRALLGPWTPDGLFNISGLAIDGKGQLWAAEDDGSPRRVSVWDAQTGAFKAEYFGSSSYGAMGSAINPLDPFLMVGQGCEWRIDPQTGKAACLGAITREGMGSVAFGFGPKRQLFLATSPSGGCTGISTVRLYERLGDAQYKLRARLTPTEKEGAEKGKKRRVVEVWSDANDDAQEQPDEIKTYDIDLGGWIQGWYLSMSRDMSFYGSLYQVTVSGWTPCGAPIYDFSQAKKMAGPENAQQRGGMGAMHGMGSPDGRYMLWNGCYGEDHSTVECFDLQSGRRVWAYPSNFTGVHGSHRACAPEVGMIRGAYDICGSGKLPEPVGSLWVIPTNKGEWHVLTEKGFYLTKLFEGDPMKNVWPEKAVPGASMDTCPPGAGEEAFGGSITQQKDGKLSVQAGHISFWNLEVVGLESIRALTGGKVSLSDDDAKTAQSWREKYLQESTGLKSMAVQKASPQFTGSLEKDFKTIVSYQKMESAHVRTGVAWDDASLYVAWEVKDDTPWVNGADAPEFLYARGDTVDLQLGTDPAAKADRNEAVLGDLRLSIGPFQGKPTAVLYRKVAAEKHPKSFNSGVIKDYVMESVLVLKDARIEVKVDNVNRQYTVEAAIPIAALGFSPKAGLKLRGDVGVTHSNKAGNDTALRTYWSNQSTGLVSDEVFELQMSPKNWGEFQFGE
ncbi:MAG TPA: PQQ-binding-like beta-propeller repeat protein [Planctomycetota bacterium]|jgi:hypothetical protein